MKNSTLGLMILALLIFPSWTLVDKKDWIKNATRKHSPDSWHLLMLYDALPQQSEAPNKGGGRVSTRKSTPTFHYLEGRSRLDLLSSMETNVHEISHGYFYQNTYAHANEKGIELDFDHAEGYVYMSPEQAWFVSFPGEQLFPSHEIAFLIPGELRTFRYDTYIEGNTSTQSNGVIGLLNEFHAYYLGSKFNFDMLEAYKEAEGSAGQGLFSWVQQSQSSMTAYYEFDFFIRTYLAYMRIEYPDNYRALMSNEAFVDAYTTLQAGYARLIDNYLEKINKEMESINARGKDEIRIEGNVLWLRLGESLKRSGTPIFSEARELLMPLLK